MTRRNLDPHYRLPFQVDSLHFNRIWAPIHNRASRRQFIEVSSVQIDQAPANVIDNAHYASVQVQRRVGVATVVPAVVFVASTPKVISTRFPLRPVPVKGPAA